MGHVTKNIGGVYETIKSVEEPGDIYSPTPVAIQKSAMAFLQSQLFTTPNWLLDNSILNKISNPVGNERVQSIQTNTLRSLLDKGRLLRLNTSNTRFSNATYSLHEMMDDLRKGLFGELTTQKPTDVFRRNLQKTYVSQLHGLINPIAAAAATAGIRVGAPMDIENSDIISEAKSQLKKLAASLKSAHSSDPVTQSHYDDLQDRIKKALDPK